MRTRPAALLVLLVAAALPGTATASAAAAPRQPVVVGVDAADALVAGVLGGGRGAPLLLAPPSGALPAATRAFLERRAGTLTSVVVVGGEDAVSPSVLDEALQAAGLR